VPTANQAMSLAVGLGEVDSPPKPPNSIPALPDQIVTRDKFALRKSLSCHKIRDTTLIAAHRAAAAAMKTSQRFGVWRVRRGWAPSGSPGVVVGLHSDPLPNTAPQRLHDDTLSRSVSRASQFGQYAFVKKRAAALSAPAPDAAPPVVDARRVTRLPADWVELSLLGGIFTTVHLSPFSPPQTIYCRRADRTGIGVR
jgi:hypothetical protein